MELSSINDAVRFVHEWSVAPKKRQAAVDERMPVAAVRAAAVIHPDPEMRRSCLFFLDHYDCDGSVETFRQALRDPVSLFRPRERSARTLPEKGAVTMRFPLLMSSATL